MRRTLRLVALTWWLHVKMLNRSAFDTLLTIVWPLFFATIALLLYRMEGDADALTYAAFGAGVMTIWTAISSTASAILLRERGSGTLELLVAAPVPFSVSIVSMVLAVSTIGGYGMAATLVWSAVVFGVDIAIAQPLLFAVAVVVTLVSFAVIGFILSVTVVRYRAAWALGAAFEYPVWLVCGFLVPVALLPDWLRPVSWLLPPSWGMAAVRAAVAGQVPGKELLACAVLVVVYAAAGVWLAGTFLHSARRHATLSLR
ncbi:ABC transporter permease [Actinophytocola glycyrrhizae]|uniref:ABC transporter permease n=1 Tax=Actinophytocola glycyrrhizae TaxID=2044873 RepID=A0ABV9S6H4_9PSEU